MRFPASQGLLSPGWLVPIGAFLIWSLWARGTILGLPTTWAPSMLAALTGLVIAAWLIGSSARARPIVWLLAGIGLAIAAFVVVDPTHTLAPVASASHRLLIATAGAGASLGGWWFGRRRGAAPGPLDLLAAIVIVAMLITDAAIVRSPFQRDLGIYLAAGHQVLAGGAVYITQPLRAVPTDPSRLPFVYPPPTLPWFALLSLPPQAVVAVAWLIAQIGAALVAIHQVGVPWRWVPALAIWPPIVQGVWVGNVAIWMFVLFALVPMRSALVGLPAIFKAQTGLAGLWLLRERRWRAVVGAVALVVGLCLIALPVGGLTAWADWIRGLLAFEASTASIPSLRALALVRWDPPLVALALAALGVVLAFRTRAGASLAELGAASVAVSPTLYLHGLTMALPAVLQARAPVFWLIVLASFLNGLQGWLWVLLLVTLASPMLPLVRHMADADEARWHPLERAGGPWPEAGRGGGAVRGPS